MKVKKTKNWYAVIQRDKKNPLYTITKFDTDFNPLDSYTLADADRKVIVCNCMAYHRPTCRHRQMLITFMAEDKINSGEFYDYDNKIWHRKLDI